MKVEGPVRDDPAVAAFIAKLDASRGAGVAAIRGAILGASPKIGEGIKWNAPSFRLGDYFATTNLNPKGGVRLVLHTGAKVRETGVAETMVKDPSGLLQWLAKDRAMVSFADAADAAAKGKALQAIIRQWIKLI